MNKFFLLLVAINAVAFINSKEFKIDEYYDYFVTLVLKTYGNLDCPTFLFSNKENILGYYDLAVKKVKKGTKWENAMSEAGLQVFGLPGFRDECKEISLIDIIGALNSSDEKKNEINVKMYNDKATKTELFSNGFGYMYTTTSSDINERLIKSSAIFGKFLAVFLGLKETNIN